MASTFLRWDYHIPSAVTKPYIIIGHGPLLGRERASPSAVDVSPEARSVASHASREWKLRFHFCFHSSLPRAYYIFFFFITFRGEETRGKYISSPLSSSILLLSSGVSDLAFRFLKL